MISPIGLAAGGIGGGLGLMALLNKEKGESLSSYPEPSRLEQVVGKEPNKNELSNAKMDEQWFKEHINIWRKVTEMEGLWDRGTINWKEKGDKYIKDPDFQEFVNSADIEKKKKLLESKRIRDDFTFEEMHDNDYKNFIVAIAPQYERKDQFGHGTIQGQEPSMGNLEMQDVARY